MSQKAPPLRLLRTDSVLERVAISRTELHRRIKAGKFPAPIKLGLRTVAWPESSIEEYIASLVEGGAK